MNSLEYKILASAADPNPGAQRLDKLGNLMSGRIDTDHLINLAAKEGLGGLLYRNLDKAGVLERVGTEQRRRLQSIYYKIVSANLKIKRDLKEILQQLNRKNTRVILLQGMTLLEQIYADLGLRPLADIDIWVLPGERHALDGLFNRLGYEKDSIYPDLFKKGSTIIDVHTHLLWADRIKTRSFLITTSQEDIYRNTQSIHIEGQKALCLNSYDQVLYLSLHVLKHYANRLIWLVDIQGLIKDWDMSDWHALLSRSKTLGVERIFSYILFLLDSLLDYQVPSYVQSLLNPKQPGFIERAILRQREKRGSISTWGQLLLISAAMTPSQRTAFFFESLFPRPAILKQVFAHSPDLSVWQLYWKRGLQIIGIKKA